jgi:oxysterol-binding protein-related protein 8
MVGERCKMIFVWKIIFRPTPTIKIFKLLDSYHQRLTFSLSLQWHYKYADLRPWDIRNDVRQYESSYRIQTKTRHQAPIVRTASIVSSEPLNILKTESRSSLAARRALSSIQNTATTPSDRLDGVNSDSSGENDTLVSSSK